MSTLADLCVLIVDCEHKTAPIGDGYAMSVGTKAMKGGRIVWEAAKPVSAETYTSWTRRGQPVAGDLILAREAPVGEVVRVPASPPVCLGQRTVLIRANDERVDPRGLHYWLRGPLAQAVMSSRSGGATVAHLNVEDVRALDVSSIEGHGDRLRATGAILGAIDDLIENNRRRVEVLEEVAGAHYADWLGSLTDVDCTTFGEIASVVLTSVAPQEVDPETPYVGLEHIPRRRLTLNAWGAAADVASRKLVFETDDVLFGKIRPYFHKVAVAPLPGICSSDTIILRTKRAVDWSRVVMTASSDSFVAHAVQTSNGTKMPRADWKVLKDFPVPHADAASSRRLQDIVRPALLAARALEAEGQALAALRDLLLPKLVSGEVDVSGLRLG